MSAGAWPRVLAVAVAVLVAGCAGTGGSPPAPDRSTALPGPHGVHAEAHVARVDEGLRVWGKAVNQGTQELRTTGRCNVPAWSHRLDPDHGYGWLFYQGVIQCLDSKAMPPGDERAFDVTWNYTYVADGAWHRVPAGGYDWKARFEVYDCQPGDQGCQPRVMTLRLPIHVPPP